MFQSQSHLSLLSLPKLSLPKSCGTQGLTTAKRRRRPGFTLVELLVVIAIIGVLVALLLPAIQAAREAARRLQCKNKVKQMALAVLNHEAALGIFPTGGTHPWPSIENYSQGGSANAAPKQGLSWAFQVLPYLEQNAIHGITTTKQIEQTPVPLYFCPSRRAPTQSLTGQWLMDYASATTGDFDLAPLTSKNFEKIYHYSERNAFWGGGGSKDIWTVRPTKISVGYNYMGVMVRTDWAVDPDPKNPVGYKSLGNTPPVTMAMIEDGTSKTLLIGEKRLASARYETGSWDDDRGWSDGWDPDTVRSTAFPVRQDVIVPSDDQALKTRAAGSGVNRFYGFCFGSAHPGGINMSFADGSVHTINYDVDALPFNQLGHRSDGAAVSLEDL